MAIRARTAIILATYIRAQLGSYTLYALYLAGEVHTTQFADTL